MNPEITDHVVRVRNLAKTFRVYPTAWTRFAGLLNARRNPRFHEVHALRDVSFEVTRGECFAILGRNGAGKSTLLRLLKGALFPTSGVIEVRGRLTLLELGTGFHPELTGRENIFQSAVMLGLPLAEIRRRFDDIVEFSELGDFIDQRIRTYSTGMVMRLAFSLYAFIRPEVYVVDEAFAVGDVFFQQKCFGRIEQYLASGGTMILVTHDTGAVLRLCQRAMVLREGRVDFLGPASEAVNRYYARTESLEPRSHSVLATAAARALPAPYWRHAPNGSAIPDAVRITPDALRGSTTAHRLDDKSRYGNHAVTIDAIRIVDASGNPTLSVEQGRTLYVQTLLRARTRVEQLNQGLHLFDRTGLLVYAGSWANRGKLIGPLEPGQEIVSTLAVTLALAPGEYSITVGAGVPVVEGGVLDGITTDRVERAAVIRIFETPRRTDQFPPFYGLVQLPLECDAMNGTGHHAAPTPRPLRAALITSSVAASGASANVGDEIIRLGIQNLLDAAGMVREDFLVCKVNMATLHEQLPGEARRLNDKLLDADLIISAGTPFLWNLGDGDHRCSSIHWIKPLWDDRIRKVWQQVPVLNLGIGAVQALNAPVEILSDVREIRYFLLWAVSVCRATTVRDRFARSVYAALDQDTPLLPCPAFLSAAMLPPPPPPDAPIVFNYMAGAGHFRIDPRLNEDRWISRFSSAVDFCRKRGDTLLFTAHSDAEAELARRWATPEEISRLSTPQQAVDVYSRARAGVINRVHGSICLAGLGRAAMLIGADTRLFAAEECGIVARPEWEVTPDEITDFIARSAERRNQVHEQSAARRDAALRQYLEIIRPHLPRTPRPDSL